MTGVTPRTAQRAAREKLLLPDADTINAVTDRLYQASMAQTSTRVILAVVAHLPKNKRPWVVLDGREYETKHVPAFERHHTVETRVMSMMELSSATLWACEAGYQRFSQIDNLMTSQNKVTYIQEARVKWIPKTSWLFKLFQTELPYKEMTEYRLVYDENLTRHHELEQQRAHEQQELAYSHMKHRQRREHERRVSVSLSTSATATRGVVPVSRGGGEDSSSSSDDEGGGGGGTTSASSHSKAKPPSGKITPPKVLTMKSGGGGGDRSTSSHSHSYSHSRSTSTTPALSKGKKK